MSKIPFSSIAVSTEVFPDFVTPVTIEGPGLTTTFDDVSGNVISVNYDELTQNISNKTFASLPIVEGTDDNNANCKYVQLPVPLTTGNYKIRFTFGQLTNSAITAIDGNAIFRLGYKNNIWNSAPIFAMSPKTVFCITAAEPTKGTAQNYTSSDYWNTEANSVNVVELDITFANDSNNIIVTPKINNKQVINTNGNIIQATIDIISQGNAREFRYFSITTDLLNSLVESDPVQLKFEQATTGVLCTLANNTVPLQTTFLQDVIIPATAPTTSATAAVTKFYVDTNIAMLIENINTTASNVLALDAYVDNVSSYTSTINEKLNTVSGDVATIITFRDWPDDE